MKASLGRWAIQLARPMVKLTRSNILRILYHRHAGHVKGFISQVYRSFADGPLTPPLVIDAPDYHSPSRSRSLE